MIRLLQHTRRPDISFCRNGMIRIAAPLARALHIRHGDAINIAVIDGEFLLHVELRAENAVGRHVARCYRSKKGSDNFCANSVELARALLDAAACGGEKAAFHTGLPFDSENKRFVPIITRKPL